MATVINKYDGGIPTLDQLGPIPKLVDEENAFLMDFMSVGKVH